MLEKLIDLSLANRFLVLVLTGIMAACGIYAALVVPLDAVPDMTNVQVQVVTEADGLPPVEIERLVTNPIESTLGGLAGIEEVRSVSKYGISSVTLVFREGTDVLRARQAVTERLPEARDAVGPQFGDPVLMPLTTALGEVLQFEVRGRGYSPMDLRTILEWQIAPRLRLVPGITEINAHGGYYRSFEVQVHPDRLAALGVSLHEVLESLRQNNATAGGGYIVHHDEQRFIRGEALLQTASDIAQVVVRARQNDAPILVRDLGAVEVTPLTRQGSVTRDGRGEIVTGMVMMLIGENSRNVVHAAKERLREIQGTLPPGVQVEVLYDRADLIGRTLETVWHNLFVGGALVVVVLLLLLGSLRAGLIVAVAIPLSMMFATNLMLATGITASLMSLGAIDFGLIVDSSVIMIENCLRRLAENREGRSPLEVVRAAALEVRAPTMFGELIIAVVYLPILALEGTEGKLFRPMALTVLFALAGSLVLSLTLMPVLASWGLPKRPQHKEVWLIRALKWIYRPLVEWAVVRPGLVVAAALAVVLLSIPLAWNLGAEFMPRLDEGDLLIEVNRLPSASLEGAEAVSTQIENLLLEFPEVKTVFCRTGRPEVANDIMGVQQTDVWVLLRPVEDWPAHKTRDELIAGIEVDLKRNVPGISLSFTQPIEMRVDELVAGVKADVAVILQGDDLKTLTKLSHELERILRSIPGAVDVKAEHQADTTALTILARPDRLARYSVSAAEVLQTVSALGGTHVGEVFEGRMRFPLVVRFPKSWRENRYLMEQIPVARLGGRPVTLAQVADFKLEETPPSVEHEGGRRRTYVQCNVRGRDVAGFVQAAAREVATKVRIPTGYELRWGGDFEHLQTASWRLTLITPFVLLLIWLLLYTTFRSNQLALLIFFAVPMAASGGILALAVRGMPFSISAGVGFIALFGVAVLNGLVWVSGAEHARATGLDPRTAARETALVRIRPVLMTALVASLGFLPMALSTTAGAEIQRPLATVVIGGLVTSTLLTALVVPAIYPWFAPREINPHIAAH